MRMTKKKNFIEKQRCSNFATDIKFNYLNLDWIRLISTIILKPVPNGPTTRALGKYSWTVVFNDSFRGVWL